MLELLEEERRKRIILNLWWYFSTDTVTIQEEKLIFEAKDLLAWIGGAVGIFVGYSFFDFSSHIIDVIFHCINKIINK